MNKLFKTLSILAAIALFITACGAQAVQAQSGEPAAPAVPGAPKDATYETVLGKSVTSNDVADFIASNNCTPAGEFQLCPSAGLALWADADQTIRTAYLSISNSDTFAPYRGELPLGLAADDTMATVEQKFGHPRDIHMLPGPWEPGLPDEGSTPDHFHYWANYKRFGLTVIYNSPSADDKEATIYAILVSK